MNIENEIKALHEAVRRTAPDDTVLFQLEITADSMTWTVKCRSANDVAAHGVSMRNLKGDWIVSNDGRGTPTP